MKFGPNSFVSLTALTLFLQRVCSLSMAQNCIRVSSLMIPDSELLPLQFSLCELNFIEQNISTQFWSQNSIQFVFSRQNLRWNNRIPLHPPRVVPTSSWESEVAAARASEIFIKIVSVLTVINCCSNYSMLADNNAVALAIFKVLKTLSTSYFRGFFCKKYLQV